jgi:hypothetical protein
MFKSLIASLIFLLTGCTPLRPAANSPDFSSPVATYRTYLLAIKADDERAAKECWWIPDDDRSGALDVVVGMHAAHHRCAGLLARRFGEATKPFLDEISQFTDVTIDRELKELPQAQVQVAGDTATVTLPDYAHDFRKIGGVWKIDFNASTGLKGPADFFQQGSWGPQLAVVVRLMRELSAELERRDYKTIEEFKAGLESKRKLLEASKPLDK